MTCSTRAGGGRHTYYRFHICVLDPNGHAAYTCFATMLSEAWRVAEGNVRRRNLSK